MMKRNHMTSTPWAVGRRFGKRGIGMIEVMLLIAVMSSLLIAGFMQWRVRSYENTSRAEQVKLTQADAAVLAFATIAFRLPCPDTDRDGLEDCGATAQKGWLPTTTLRLAGADPGIQAGQLRYLVQRGSPAIDLATGADDWRPLAYDSNAVSSLPSNYAGAVGAIQTLSDMCSRLVTGNATAFAAGFASVASPTPRLVAYALAHPGTEDGDGDGDLFDGQNALTNASQLEPSDRRSAVGQYDDVVFERSMVSVRSAMGCDVLNNSIDATSLAADVVDVVKTMKDGNISDGTKAVAWAAASAILSALTIVQNSLEIVSDSANSAIDSVICAASLGLAVNACAAIGVHAAAAIYGGGEIAANIVSVALSATAVGLAATALGVADADGTSPPQPCTAAAPNPAIPQLTQQIAGYQADLVTLNSSLTVATTARTTAINNSNSVTNQLRALIRNVPPFPVGTTSSIDGQVDTLLGAAGALLPQQVAFEAATAQRDNAQTSYNSAVQDVTRYQNMVANQAALTITTQASLAAATSTLSVLKSTPGTATQTIADQETVVNRLRGELQLLTETPQAGQTPTLVVLVNTSIAERDGTATTTLTAATAALNTATTNRTNGISSYSSAYAGLVTASGGYTVTFPSVGGAAAVTATFSSSPATSTKLPELFGVIVSIFGFPPFIIETGASAPSENSLFNLPQKLQRQIDSLNKQITETNAALTLAQANLAKLQVPQPLPAECNFTLNPARPFKPDQARAVLILVDQKGGTR